MNTTSCQCEHLSQQECKLSVNNGAKVYMANLIVIVMVVIVIIITTIYWLICRKRREGRYSSNHMYLQADNDTRIEDNLMIDGFTIKLSKSRQISEESELELEI